MCPVCNDFMLVLELHGIDIDWCDQCRGAWFDTGELELLIKRCGSPPDVIVDTLYRSEEGRSANCRCPRCRNRLREVGIGAGGHAVLARCPQGHGLWWPGGEMPDLLREIGRQSVIAEFLGQVCQIQWKH